MAEGGDYDPTTEKTPLIPGTEDGDDDDDGIDWDAPIDFGPDEPDEPDKTQPFEPGPLPPQPVVSQYLWPQGFPPRNKGSLQPKTQWRRVNLRIFSPTCLVQSLNLNTKKAPKSGGAVIKVKYHNSGKWYSLYTKSKGNEEKTLKTAWTPRRKSKNKRLKNAKGWKPNLIR